MLQRWFIIVGGALIVLIAGLALADRFDVEWLRIATMVAVPAGSALLVMWTKTRRARPTRSAAADSVEAAVDRDIRASVFIDALVLLALACLLGVLLPELSPWILPLALLVTLTADYWVRFALSRAQNASVDGD